MRNSMSPLSPIKKSMIRFTILLITLLCIPHVLKAITEKDIQKALRSAEYEEMTAEKLEDKLLDLEEKLKEAQEDVEKKEKNLEIIYASIPRNPGKIKRAEGTLKKASKKVANLTKKIDESKSKLTKSQKKAEQVRHDADGLAARRQTLAAKNEIEETTLLLEYYENKVEELEITERELRAEALAKTQIASMKGGGGRWSRWGSSLDEKRADALVDQLRIYREKVKETKKELDILIERNNPTEIENSQVRQ